MAIFLLFLLCGIMWGILILVLWKTCRILSWNPLVLGFILVGRLYLTVSIYSAIIGVFNLLIWSWFNLVSDIYPESCPFPLCFPILWSTSFQNMTWWFSVFPLCLLLHPPFISDFVSLDILSLPFVNLDKGVSILLFSRRTYSLFHWFFVFFLCFYFVDFSS